MSAESPKAAKSEKKDTDPKPDAAPATPTPAPEATPAQEPASVKGEAPDPAPKQENTPAPKGEIPAIDAIASPERVRGEQMEMMLEARKGWGERLSDAGAKKWESVSAEGRRLFELAGDKFLGAPNRMVGKLGMAYNQFWADRHELAAAKSKAEMDGLDMGIRSIDDTRQMMQQSIDEMRQSGMPGTELLELKLKTFDVQKREALNKRDKMQTRFEDKENRRNVYVNRRDEIADKFVNRYEEKLAPMESALEHLSARRDRLNLLSAVTETKHREQTMRLDSLEKNAQRMEDALRAAGTSDRQIRKNEGLKLIRAQIAEGRAKINEEKQAFTKRKNEIDAKIAAADRRANPFRDRREQYVRIKENRPLEMNVRVRERGTADVGRAATNINTRPDAPPAPPQGPRGPGSGGGAGGEGSFGGAVESAEAVAGPNAEQYIAGYFGFMRERDPKASAWNGDAEKKFLTEFLRTTGYGEGNTLLPDEFRNVMEKYLKTAYPGGPDAVGKQQKATRESILKSVDEFLKEVLPD